MNNYYSENHYDVIVLGAGAAGLTAGIYLSRAKLKTLILNEGTTGGQMVLTHEIANYPGVDTISGFELARNMKAQAQKFGCVIKSNIKITGFGLTSRVKYVTINDKITYTAEAVIITTGGRPRPLGVPGEEEFRGKGISYCATCDGDFFQDKKIVVVGGGNSALEEAVSLTKYASKVTIVHQFDHFQALEHYVENAMNNEKINFIMESTVAEFRGTEKLDKVVVKNLKTNELTELAADGTFIFIGYIPNTEKFAGVLKLSNYGEIMVDAGMATNIPGVYAGGDSINKRYRQITTAVADGTIAALNAAEYVNNLKKEKTAEVV